MSKKTDCGEFCGAIELALPGHDRTQSSDIQCVSDVLLEDGLKPDVSDYNLHSWLKKSQIFFYIQADETTDIPTRCQKPKDGFKSILRHSKGFFFSPSRFRLPPLTPIDTALMERLASLPEKRVN